MDNGGIILAYTFSKGIHPDDHKELTAELPLVAMPVPDVLYIPLLQHLGAPTEAVVAAGDKVKAGTLIGKAKGYVSSNIYSSVSGEVKGIVSRKSPQGNKIPHVEIINDKLYEEQRLPSLINPSGKNIVSRIQEAGIVGMGGATFPTHVKLSPNKPVDTLIINAAECEPYITCDYRLMLEVAEDIIEGTKYLMSALNVTRAIIGIEDNKPKAINKLSLLTEEGIEVCALKAKYPQGAEKQLIYALTKRKVPIGGLPMDVGVVVVNLHSAYSIALAVRDGIVSHTRAMTVSGKAIANPCNIIVRTGTTYQDIYNYCKGDGEEIPALKVLSGGPMMGFAQADLSASVTKGTSSLLFLTADEVNTASPDPCINCTACSHVCPMNLMPMFIDSYTISKEYELVKRYHVMNCIECGSCSYICPAKRPLLQSIRLAKKQIKEKGI